MKYHTGQVNSASGPPENQGEETDDGYGYSDNDDDDYGFSMFDDGEDEFAGFESVSDGM